MSMLTLLVLSSQSCCQWSAAAWSPNSSAISQLRAEGQKGFVVLPRRWVVERTFAWLTQCRRLGKDYEVLPSSSEALIYIAMTRLMVRRLAAA